ncbi:hypothetical protein TNCV_2710571 [Trichonephila clavipes]|nr:hypothetical protein TNCV_2710571 [Trichonephila clavipes]
MRFLHDQPPLGEKTFQMSDKSGSAAGRDATCPDVWRILRCDRIFQFQTDLMGPDRYTRDFNHPGTTRSLIVLNLETEEAMGTCSAC